jgi:hypothetical protein
MKKWREKGPLGKIYNIVVYIQCSIPRRHDSAKLAKNRLYRDNSTRWNSWFNMLKSVLLNRESINKYFEVYLPKKGKDGYLYKSDSLTDAEWSELEVISKILDALKQTTKALEQGESFLMDALIAMDYCLALFEGVKAVNRGNPKLIKMLNSD